MISIAMATYNGEKYLEEQIDSILAQSYSDFELIISDDCSTDATRIILKKYEEKDSRIKLHFNETNLGFKKNFEQTLRLCSGEFIAFADQDDVWLGNHLEILINNIGDADLVGGNSILTDSCLNPVGYTMQDVTGIKIDKAAPEFLFLHELYANIFQGTACLFRSTLLKHILPIPDCILFHDYWAALIAGVNNGLRYTSNPVLLYRQHEKQITKNTTASLFTLIEQTLKGKKINIEQKQYQIQILNQLLKRTYDKDKQIVINKVIKYNENLLAGKRSFAICHFLKNYTIIYGNFNFFLFILRFIKLLIGLI